MSALTVLTLPGWQGSSADHWQSRWDQLYGYQRVEQHDWMRPLRGDWIARLEEVVLERHHTSGFPAVLVAHSLGCIQVAAWAAHSRNSHLVRAALLVAPPDVERDDLRAQLPGWAPVHRQRLPFASQLIASSNDPLCALPLASAFAADWGADLVNAGPLGHLNAASGLRDWPDGHTRLQALMLSAPGTLPIAPQ